MSLYLSVHKRPDSCSDGLSVANRRAESRMAATVRRSMDTTGNDSDRHHPLGHDHPALLKWQSLLGSSDVQISEAAKSLGPFDRLDLSQRVGALQLMPENGANVLRLELAASVLSTLPAARDLSTISTRRWRRWLEDSPFSDQRVRFAEDPPCNPFTETVVFFGGSYTVLPGNSARSAFLLQTLLRAIVFGDQEQSRLSNDFRRSAHDLALAALTLSNECAAKAGLGRDEKAHTVPTNEVIQPQGERLARLRDAATFSSAALETQLSRRGVDLEVLSSLSMDTGTEEASEVNMDDLPVYRRPMLRIDGNYVLIAPGSLPAALTHAILSKASECGDLAALAERFRGAVFESVDRALNHLGCSRLSGPQVSNDLAFPVTRALYNIDSDKALDLILLTDPLEHFDSTTIDGEWPTEKLSGRVEEEIRAFEERMVMRGSGLNGVLSLVALASPGRSVSLGLGTFRFAQLLLFSAGDLEVIAHTEPGHRLLLWQYAKARNRLRDYARVTAFDPLDEFAVWRDNGFTYYMSDERRPAAVLIPPGSAVDMRIEARDALDCHGLPAANGVGTAEVVRFHKGDVPIYRPIPGSAAPFALVVEGLPLTLWVEAVRTMEDRRFEQLMHGLVDLIAYWIWQFEPHLRETLERLAEQFDPLVLKIDLVESEAWFTKGVASREALEIARTDRGFKLTFREGTAVWLGGDDNAGERQIVRRLLETLHDGGRDAVGVDDRPSEDAVAQALDTYAPLGPKKKLFRIGGEASRVLDESGLPSYRPLQPAASEEWRDREQELLDRLDLPLGPVAPEERVATLTGMVAESFMSFEHFVATLSPEGLLETLVAYGERLIQRHDYERKAIPTQIACFGTVPEMVEEMKREGPVLATTAITHRFVTEYVVARPPSGLRPFSLEAYDELIALAAILVGWGRDSDAIYYGHADTQLTVLESGRLGRHTTGYGAAVEDFGERAYAEQIMRSSVAFSSMFQSPTDPAPDPPIPVSELEVATKAEFGINITQIANFLQVLVEIGSEQQGPTKRLRVTEARERVASELGWSEVELDAAFGLLILGPRAVFLDPPPGFKPWDLYPWAFNRRLSYLSRPLLLKEESGGAPELVWGTRALIRSKEYLFQQLVDGRLMGQSDHMRSLQGKITKHYGEVFNDRVAEVYEAAQALTVRRRVTSIAGRHIERQPGQPLGDIDVLVVDPLSKEMLLVETKNFSAVRTPAEFASEEKKLRRALKTHGERATWLCAHLRDALQWLSIADGAPDAWRVKQLVVVSGEVFTPGLRELPVPVITLSTLRNQLATDRGVARSQNAGAT